MVKHTFLLCPNSPYVPGSCLWAFKHHLRAAGPRMEMKGEDTSPNSAVAVCCCRIFKKESVNCTYWKSFRWLYTSTKQCYLLYDVYARCSPKCRYSYTVFSSYSPNHMFSTKKPSFSHWFPTLQLFEAFSDKYFNKTRLFPMFYPCCSPKYWYW